MGSPGRKYQIVFAALLFLNSSCFFNETPKEDAPVNFRLLKKDFAVLRKTLEEAHPGLYWYTDKRALNNYLDSTYATLDHDITTLDFFRMLLPVIAKIRCVHTNLRLSKDLQHNPAGFYRLLPFTFFCRKGKLYISGNSTGTGYLGAEVLSINHVSKDRILETLLSRLPADGYNETFKYYLLSNGAFREGYALFFGQPGTFIMEVVDQGKVSPVVFTTKAISPEQLPLIKRPSIPAPLHLSIQANLEAAVLSVNTFELQTKRFSDTLASIFSAISSNHVKHLVIDLQKNSGGNNDNVSTLFSYMALGSFLHLKRAEMNAPPFTWQPYFANPKDFNKLHGLPTPDGQLLMNYRYAGTAVKQPVTSNLFKGDVIVLTSGNTTSAASEFAAIAQYTHRATIVGEETGGCYYGATGGLYIDLILPTTKLAVRIPAIRIFTAVKDDFAQHPKGRGTMPDYEVIPQIADILEGKDVALQKALDLLIKNKKQHYTELASCE